MTMLFLPIVPMSDIMLTKSVALPAHAGRVIKAFMKR